MIPSNSPSYEKLPLISRPMLLSSKRWTKKEF